LDAYLDIETTGLYSYCHRITVVGISFGDSQDVVQCIGDDITADRLLEILKPASTIYTYNGHRFDLPFIQDRLGINLVDYCKHQDLMFHCWRRNLYGGLKAVERRLGITRRLKDINGIEAVRLWYRYENDSDEEALRRLLEYNQEDVLNLKVLRKVLI
jgi:uncharacterized protein YprB with RNaseH-like and TPR domain